MLLIELPDDVLFRILQFTPPTHILVLRKTCRRFHSLTLERTVWINAYRNSTLFLAPGPSLRRSVRELERILVRAYKLDLSWESSEPSVSKRNWSFKCKIGNGDIRCTELYQGRYLALGGLTSFFVYDIRDQRQVFGHTEDSKRYPFWFYCRSGVVDADNDDGDLFIPVGKWLSKSSNSLHLALWKIDCSGSVTMIDAPHVKMLPVQMRIGYGYCVCVQKGGPVLFHIASQKLYTFGDVEGRSGHRLTDVVIMAHHVLLVYTLVDLQENKFLDLYSLPDSNSDTILPRQHTGVFSASFNEAHCISSDIAEGGTTGIIWLAVLFSERGLMAMRITLNSDQSISFHLAEDQARHADPYISNVLSHPYDCNLTVIPGSRARGVARTASLPGRPMLALYSLHLASNGDVSVNANCVGVPQLPLADSYTFDGLSGLLCIAADNQIDILEFA